MNLSKFVNIATRDIDINLASTNICMTLIGVVLELIRTNSK